jgi:hypothetical protein
MLNKVAAALIAATMLTTPVLAAGATQAAGATTETNAPSKPANKAVVHKHRKHAHHMTRGKAKYVKVMRHGKVVYLKVKPPRHQVKQAHKTVKPSTTQSKKASKVPAA